MRATEDQCTGRVARAAPLKVARRAVYGFCCTVRQLLVLVDAAGAAAVTIDKCRCCCFPPAGLALVVAQEHVDEHGVGGQLVQLLGADGRQLAAMRDRHQQAMAAAAAAAADGAVTGPGGAASGGGLGGGAAEAAEAARRVCRAVHEAMGR